MGLGRNLRCGSVAGGPTQDGRRISADWLLRRLLPGFRAQLYGRRTLWLARDVLVRVEPGDCFADCAPSSKRAGALAEESNHYRRSSYSSTASDLLTAIHPPDAGEHGFAGSGDLRIVGRGGVCADGPD